MIKHHGQMGKTLVNMFRHILGVTTIVKQHIIESFSRSWHQIEPTARVLLFYFGGGGPCLRVVSALPGDAGAGLVKEWGGMDQWEVSGRDGLKGPAFWLALNYGETSGKTDKNWREMPSWRSTLDPQTP